ncbi:MAG: hypothetical protein KIT44_07995 [Opitutaceae bacterium]|nr:hypothetical protein [Opitutaceae bacterium]
MKIHIDIDKDEAARPFTLRERCGLHILLIIFRMIYPTRFDHQIDSALAPLAELIERK